MIISFVLNGKKITDDISPDMYLIDYLRNRRCYSVKRGCETANCGLCTVWLDGKSVLSCSMLALQIDGRSVTTLEGLQREAQEFGQFMAAEGAEQCGFCNPGFVMNLLAMEREMKNPEELTTEEIREYLAGNLCRCTGFAGQERAIRAYFQYKKEKQT